MIYCIALHKVQTITVEKADAGTLDQCLGSLVISLYTKQQLSIYIPAYSSGEFTPASLQECR